MKITRHLALRGFAVPSPFAGGALRVTIRASALLAAALLPVPAAAAASAPQAARFALAARAPLAPIAGDAAGVAASAAAVVSNPAAPADFSGRWTFRPAKSANIGMMAGLEMHVTVEQSPALLAVHEDSIYQGQKSAREVRYDLGGQPVANRSPMGDPSETVSHWDGSRLVTTWTSQGAVAGTQVVRTETRSLSVDGRTMTLASVRGSAAPLIMVFERE